jgi:pimeloyl-ACP methyl ester carboxylesterase
MRTILTTVALVLVSLLTVAHAAAPGDQVYARPGRLVHAGAAELNIYCMGSGSPAVVFDAGWEDWSPTWAKIQPIISRRTRTCTYDRAGSGFSLPGPMPRTSVEIARELHSALHNARIRGPYLLVGHSFGGYNTRAFADMYMAEVFGAVFVDVESGDLESAKSRAADSRELGAEISALIGCRAAVAANRPLPPIPEVDTAYGFPPNEPCSHQFFDNLPMKQWSSELNSIVLHIASTRVALYDAVISEAQEMPADAMWLEAHRRSFGSRPIRVLTAEDHFRDDDLTPPSVHREHFLFEHDWARAQRQLLLLSGNSKQVLVPRSGHYIQFDEPRLVIDAILSELPSRQGGRR